MVLLKSLRNAALLFVFSVILASTAFSQGGFAMALSTPFVTDDFTVTIPRGYDSGDNSDPLLVNRIKTADKFVSFIKFDITSLKGHTVNSAKVKLFGSGEGSASLYYVSNDAWVDENVSKAPVTQANIDALIGTHLGSVSFSPDYDLNYEFDFTSLIDLISNVNDSGDNYFSVAIKADNKFDNAEFNSKEGLNGPVLDVELAPAPEPSSMVLGFLGLSSLLGIRRKKA